MRFWQFLRRAAQRAVLVVAGFAACTGGGTVKKDATVPAFAEITGGLTNAMDGQVLRLAERAPRGVLLVFLRGFA